jgi:hypothetical protein
MAEHQLDRADVHSISEEPTRAVDLPQLGAIDAGIAVRALRLVPVGEQDQRLPCRLETGDSDVCADSS